MKVGLIGCGGMGTTHNLSLKALSSKMDVEVTALADCRPEFLEKAAEQWPDARLSNVSASRSSIPVLYSL
ncbi:hypothetical protein NE639_26690, partial [Blautia producta]|nr:hypothetical protein [Blautia producta]